MRLLKLLPPPLRGIVETLLTLALALAVAWLAQAFVIKPYEVPTLSMWPTLKPGDRVLTDRLTLDFENPHRGQIVVFHPPVCKPGDNQEGVCDTPALNERVGYSGTYYIKRVIGLPGDTVWSVDGRVWIKPAGGRAFPLREPYLAPGVVTQMTRVHVPAGYYFMMGDNRGPSDDSRMWGPEPRGEIVGIARVRYWPLDRIGLL
jgi:signal peptidase I